MSPLLLDLFCGAGGCSVGYQRAGFDVIGIDIKAQPRYPFAFHQANAIDALTQAIVGDGFWPGGPTLDDIEAIHASPPCQDHMRSRVFNQGHHGTGDLLAETRNLLQASNRPWVIENVPGAPMRADFKLCGCMFGLWRLARERWFETSWAGFDLRPPCTHRNVISVIGHDLQPKDRAKGFVRSDRKRAMGIDWMSNSEIGLAIPPAYTEYIGEKLLEHMRDQAA